jgi:hypothetical protein
LEVHSLSLLRLLIFPDAEELILEACGKLHFLQQ